MGQPGRSPTFCNADHATTSTLNMTRSDPPAIRSAYVILGIAALLTWVVLFSAGILMNSQPYREALGAGAINMTNLVNAILIYTPTNIALLCILAALTGGCASRIQSLNGILSRIEHARASGDPDRVERLEIRRQFMFESPFQAMLRGFLVFIASVSGMLIISAEPFTDPSPEQFTRLASLLSTLSFVFGFDPSRLEDVIQSLSGRMFKGKDNRPS